MDGSSVSSPLESPEAPITSSVVTLQSAESLSIRRQVRLANEAHDTTDTNKPSIQTQISLDKTPDTPSAKISQSSSEISHAFTSNFGFDANLASFQIYQQTSLDQTPDTPSANISRSRSSSEMSEAFTTHFAPENSPNALHRESCSPPIELISPSTDFFSDDRFNYLGFGDETFDISQFDYDLSYFSMDGISQKSES